MEPKRASKVIQLLRTLDRTSSPISHDGETQKHTSLSTECLGIPLWVLLGVEEPHCLRKPAAVWI